MPCRITSTARSTTSARVGAAPSTGPGSPPRDRAQRRERGHQARRPHGRTRHPPATRTGLHRAIVPPGSVTTKPVANGSGAPG